MRSPPTRLAALGAAFVAGLALLSGAGDTRAELAAGRRPPPLEALRSWPGAPNSLGDVRGSAVLLVFLSTTCPHCRSYAARMNALVAARSREGLRVIGAFWDAEDRIARFVRDHQFRAAVIQIETDAVREFEVTEVPTALFLSSNGRVLWSGDPTRLNDASIARLLAEARPWGALPTELAWAAEGIRRDELAAVRDRLARCAVTDDPCGAGTRRGAEAMIAWIDWYGASLAAAAEADRVSGRPCDAWRELDHLARAFAGREVGTTARIRLTKLLETPSVRREVDACALLEEARRILRRDGAAKALPLLERIALDHPGTEAARRAADMAKRLRRRNP